MISRYMDSVPYLKSQQFIEGYIWAIAATPEFPAGTVLSLESPQAYVGTLPDGTKLIASPSDTPPQLSGALVRPWTVQLYNDAAKTIPLAFLEQNSGRYVQLESFGLGLDGEPLIDRPARCKFLVGTTNAQTRVCPE
jgi:hypothetical protein